MTTIDVGVQTFALFMAGVAVGFCFGMAVTIWHNGRIVRKGGHCACACDKGCC